MVKQLWLLLLRSFMLVLATFLTAPPCSISVSTSASVFTTSSQSLTTKHKDDRAATATKGVKVIIELYCTDAFVR